MSDLHDARVTAACNAYQAAQNADPYDFNGRMSAALAAAGAVVAVPHDSRCYPDPKHPGYWICFGRDAAQHSRDAVVTVDGLQERIEDTLAYYQCRETNPKADHPSMGYHAFSEEQREFLRERKAESAAEIVRMILALLRGGGRG